MDKYMIVESSILPEVYQKVVEARNLLQEGKVKQISEAVKRVGISRGTYYKYKDYVFLPSQDFMGRKAVISFCLSHRKGILSEVLKTLSQSNANILTINQNIPIHDRANVVISLDMNDMEVTMDYVVKQLTTIKGVFNVQLIAIE